MDVGNHEIKPTLSIQENGSVSFRAAQIKSLKWDGASSC
jgi:hypothetical protein